MRSMLKTPAMLLGAVALTASALPAGFGQVAADDFPYTYVEVQVGHPDSVAFAINGSGLITGGWSFGQAWTSDNGAPVVILGTLGGAHSAGFGANENGDVVGNAATADPGQPLHAFLYHDGVMTDLGTGYPNGGYSEAHSVNSYLQAVGERIAPNTSNTHATLWQDGNVIDLGTLGGNTANAYGINDSGQIVGVSQAQALHPWKHAYLWQDGVMQDLGTLGSDPEAESEARAINSTGAIVGTAQFNYASVTHAVLWQDGAVTDLGALPPNRPWGYAYAVNNAGQVVGLALGPTTYQHAFLWQNGVIRDLNQLAQLPAGIELLAAYGINDSGVIVGEACSNPPCSQVGGQRRAFMLVPNNPGGGGLHPRP